MALDDWSLIDAKGRAGGQGVVRKVENKATGQIGALKLLHGDAAARTERRYRFLTEVGALRAMSGNGVPEVLEANEAQWRDKSVELYLVMELIEGPTMAELVQAAPPTVDDAISATSRIVSIIGAGHRLPLHHRDLKPDNVIFRHAAWADPVLVDLGIAWHGGSEDVGFKTPDSLELGNRFLRLPEFAPGGNHHDARSDLAMATGLLFFMLSGRAPRVTINQDGLHPHEMPQSPIRPVVLEDSRWRGLNSIMRVGFQYRPEMRFRDADEFIERLVALNEDKPMAQDDLDEEIARLRELSNSALERERAEASPAMQNANRAFVDALAAIWKTVGLVWGGQNPTFKNGGATNEFYCVVMREGQSDPSVVLHHRIGLSEGRFRAEWSIDGGGSGILFEGPASDGDGLREALLDKSRELASKVIREYRQKVEPKAD